MNLRALVLTLFAACLICTRPLFAEDGANRYPFAKGVVAKLDTSTRQLTLATPAGPRNFSVTDRTYLFRGDNKLTLDKLKLGETVKLAYYTNETGQAFVRRLKVEITPPREERANP